MQGWLILANKVNEIWLKIRKSDKKIKVFIALGLIGMLLILLSEALPEQGVKKRTEEISYTEYISSLENETKLLVEAIDGAGECRVMLTLKNTRESVYAKNSEENKSDGSYSNSYEYVLYKGQEGETPVLIKEYFPQVMGVAVVCSGADNIAVKEAVINSLSSVFDIPSSKISVSKLKD